MLMISSALMIAGTSLVAQNGFRWEKTSFAVDSSGGVSAIAATNDGIIFAGTLNKGVFRSTDNGATWSAANNGLTSLAVQTLTIDAANTVYIGTKNGAGVYRSADNGASWSPFNTGLGASNVQAIAAGANGNLIAGVGNGVAVVPQHGTSWTRGQSISKQIWTVATDMAGNAYAASPTGENYRSADYGATWKAMVIPAQGVTAMATRNDQSGTVFAVASAVYRSTDKGATWTSTLASDLITSVTTTGTRNVYVASIDGIFGSADNGVHWTPVNNGLNPSESFLTIAGANSGSPYLLLGTYGGAIYRTVEGSLGVDDAVAGIAGGLRGNFPNPCATHTTIPFDLSRAGEVSLSVYDLTGREVAPLVSGHLDAGHHEASFDASLHPNGVYFYRLHVDDRVETRTLTIER